MKSTPFIITSVIFFLVMGTFLTMYLMERKKITGGKNVSTDNDLDVVTDALGRKFPKAGSVKYTNSKGETFSSNL